MGIIALPNGSAVYIDTNVLIYAVDQIEPYATLLRPLWQASRTRSIRLVSSELLIVESLAGPFKHGNKALADAYEEIFRADDPHLLPITPPVLRIAARIRADHGLKTPDSIHAATALQGGCSMFLTNDAGFRKVAGLPVKLLDEILKTPD